MPESHIPDEAVSSAFAGMSRAARDRAVADIVATIERLYDPDRDGDFTALIDATMGYGVTAAAIAAGLNVAQGTVSRWRGGLSRPTRSYKVAAKDVCLDLLTEGEVARE